MINKKNLVKQISFNKVYKVAIKIIILKIVTKLLNISKNKKFFCKNQNKIVKTFNKKYLKIIFMNKNNNKILLKNQHIKILSTNKMMKNLYINIKMIIHMKT